MIATLTPQVNFPEAVDNFVHSPEPGVMNVHAKFDLDNHVKGRAHLYVPFMMVRRFQQGTKILETVWSQEYTDQAFALQPGAHLTPEFRQRLEMPANHYSVLVGLLERQWAVDQFGEPYLAEVPPGKEAVSYSAWHVVR